MSKMKGHRIVVVEDDEDISEVLQYNLEADGFVTELFHRGDTAWEGIRMRPPDLVVLDLMLPGLDGLELCRLMKRETGLSGIPIVMLTARNEEVDRIVGLELGADDYIPKPFSPREVVLRVKAVLRRLGSGDQDEPDTTWLEAGGIRLDPDGHQVHVSGREISLTATEFRLLRTLLERRGRTQTRPTLLSEVWGYSEEVDSRTVDTHIRRLRKKLGSEADRLETVIGVGYRLRR
jgi:two-component system phosphate regulon response regulator PhoB